MEMPSISRGRAVAYLVAVLALVALGGRFLLGEPKPAPGEAGSPDLAFEATSVAEEVAGKPSLVVHVVGAVARPGLYRLEDGSRIDDAIREAGGAKPIADLSLVNLAAPVADGQQVVVPRRASHAESAAAEEPSAPAAAAPVQLSTATLEQLDALPGVGPVTAQHILDYRDEHGGFQTVEELDAVPGIGPTRLEELRELVVP
jgi:competence protein ComEA